MPPKRKVEASVKNNMDAPPAKKIKGSVTGNSFPENVQVAFNNMKDLVDNDYDAWYRYVESVDWSKYGVPTLKLTKEQHDKIMEEVRCKMDGDRAIIG